MLSIFTNNIAIDLAKGTTLEITKQSPLYYLSESSGEYSMPVTIVYSENNVAQFGDHYFEYPIKQQLRKEVDVYDGHTFKYSCILVINKSNINKRFKDKSTLEGFLLGGISVFALMVKNVLLKNLKFGGNRSIVNCYTHFKATWDFTYDYIAAPVQNPDWVISTPYDGIMNSLDGAGNFKIDQPIGLFPKLTYLLTTIFADYGFTLDISDIATTDFDKLVLFNAAIFTPTATTLNFSLANCFDKDVTVIDFIVAICKRYGLATITNNATKTITLIALKNTGLTTYSDVTQYLASELVSDYSAPEIKYGFKNSLPSNDAALSTPDFTNWLFLSPVATKANLPTGSLRQYDNVLVFVFADNKYYKTALTANNTLLEWVVFSDNIYDYLPKILPATGTNISPTEIDIETACSTLPSYLVQYRSNGGTNYYAELPYCKQKTNMPWGIRTLLFIGLVTETLANGTTAGAVQYPMLSSLCLDNLGNKVLQWSNVFSHINPTTKIDYGIVPFWYKRWIESSNVQSTDTATFTLPLHALYDLDFKTPLLINNISYCLAQIIEPIPFLNKVQVVLKRFLLPNEIPVTPPLPIIYLRLVIDNLENIPYNEELYAWSTPNTTAVVAKLLTVHAYIDVDGTIPFSCVGLLVNFNVASPIATFTPLITVNGSSQVVSFFGDYFTMQDGSIITNKSPISISYSNAPSGNFMYALATSTAYTIIP